MRYLLAVLVLGLGVYLVTGVTQVRPGERALIRRFGREQHDDGLALP